MQRSLVGALRFVASSTTRAACPARLLDAPGDDRNDGASLGPSREASRCPRLIRIVVPRRICAVAVLALTACTADHDAPTEPVALARGDQTPPSAVGQQTPRSIDDRLVDLANRLPGFGGLAFNDDGSVRVWLLDERKSAIAEPVIRAFMQGRGKEVSGPGTPAAVLRFARGRFDWRDLVRWKRSARGIVFSHEGVRSLDADEVYNRITVGVAATADTASLRGALVAAGIPSGAVAFQASSTARMVHESTGA